MPKMPNTKEGTAFIPKNITIRNDQEQFLRKNSISLSRFVQQKLDEAMNGKKGK